MKKQAQSLIEYGLILALVAVIAVVILGKFGTTMTNSADRTNTTVSDVSNNAACNYCRSLDTTNNPNAITDCARAANLQNCP